MTIETFDGALYPLFKLIEGIDTLLTVRFELGHEERVQTEHSVALLGKPCVDKTYIGVD